MKNKINNFMAFEKDVMENIFLYSEKNTDYIKYESSEMSKIECVGKIKQQYENAIVLSRKFTGVGFFTDFHVEDTSLHLNEDVNFELGGNHIAINGLRHGIGLVLFIRKGVISFLEGYTYQEKWWPSVFVDKYQFHLVNKDGTTTKIID